MPMDRFLIAPLSSGLQTNLRPWLIMDDAFETLQNAFVFRGRLKKRFGSLLMGPSQLESRLRVQIGTTDGSGNLSFTSLPGNTLNVGAAFSAGSLVFNVITVPSVVGNANTLSTDQGLGGPAVGTVRLNSTGPNVYQFEITGGQTSIATLPVYWYPALPVMGITQYESGAVNNHPTYAFDTKFAYLFNPATPGWSRSGTLIFNTTNTTSYVWTINWQGSLTLAAPGDNPVMLATNFNATTGSGKPAATDDPIWVTPDGTNWYPLNAKSQMFGSGPANSSGFFFLPAGGAPYEGPFVQTARIIVPFKNRLVLLNTIENDNSTFGSSPGTGVATSYVNRCRYSAYTTPFDVSAWYEPNQVDSSGNAAVGGGFFDAATEEAIISAEFIKDRLIVYFERSTWELAYTGDETNPFQWNKLNTELGSQSTFSTVPFDKEILTIGNTGIHACNGSNVVRIDSNIPDEIFEFQAKQNGNLRTFGIRDYYPECVYWTFVSDLETATQTFPNQVLVYNYQNQSWALNDDCITAFGYFEQQVDTTWANSTSTWAQSAETWQSGVIEANQRVTLAGDQQGFMFRISSDTARNAPAMQITNITYNGDNTLTLEIINHNFSDVNDNSEADFPDYILIEGVIGDALTESLLNGDIFPVNIPATNAANNIVIDVPGLLSGTYLGGGTGARVSNIQWLSKQWNPYDKESRNVYLSKIDFGVQKTASGQITIDYFPSSTELSMVAAGVQTGAIMGTNVLQTSPYSPVYYPLEKYQQRLWHSIYFQVSGECIQLWAYFNPQQMANPAVSLSDFELEGLILYTQRTDSRMQ